MKSNRRICIHCHFYQPPRENPWLEEIEYQDSAYPYHDWNERINAECYRPNGESKILNDDSYLVRLKNNYAGISFNFGPTLLSWLEKHDPISYAAILEGDRLSKERFGGHGNAIAQVYNHMIMPLSNRRDKETQIKWGLRDFEQRFKRPAEAMWLAETAVDLETLEIMVEHGLSYVILAPRQARRVCPPGGAEWLDIENEDVDTGRPYNLTLPNGKRMSVFFYNGHISRAVAFEGLLHNGKGFARRMMEYFPDDSSPFLLNIATDGESYGHHHRHGDMALACALEEIDNHPDFYLTNYGEYLEHHPPEWDVEIHENSSWSCIHGISRWNEDCGCNSGHRDDWNQLWRQPLRHSFDRLRDRLCNLYYDYVSRFCDDPWAMRNSYIDVLIDPTDPGKEHFFKQHCTMSLSASDKEHILKLMEMQKNLLFMYTSCGWFFDEISGMETVQNIQYACRAVELAQDVFETTIEQDFMQDLENIPSNIPEISNARNLYESYIRPSRLYLPQLAAQYAAAQTLDVDFQIGAYEFYLEKNNHQDHAAFIQGRLKSKFLSIPYEFTAQISFTDILDLKITIEDKGGFVGHYGSSDLLLDLRRKILKKTFQHAKNSIEQHFSDILNTQQRGLEQLYINNADLPAAAFPLMRYSFNNRLAQTIEQKTIDLEAVKQDINHILDQGGDFDQTSVHDIFNSALNRSFKTIAAVENLRHFMILLQIYDHFPFPMELNDLQNDFYKWYHAFNPTLTKGNDEWKSCILEISSILKVSVDAA